MTARPAIGWGSSTDHLHRCSISCWARWAEMPRNSRSRHERAFHGFPKHEKGEPHGSSGNDINCSLSKVNVTQCRRLDAFESIPHPLRRNCTTRTSIYPVVQLSVRPTVTRDVFDVGCAGQRPSDLEPFLAGQYLRTVVAGKVLPVLS